MHVDFEKYSKPSGTGVKVWLIVILVFLLMGVGGYFYIDYNNKKAAEELYAKARDHFKASQFSLALKEINGALAYNEKLDYLSLKVNILNNQGKAYQLEQTMEALVKKDPTNDAAFSFLGDIYFSNDQLEKSLEAFKKAVALNPRNIEHKLSLANIHFKLGNKTAFKEIYENLLKEMPYYYKIWERYLSNYSSIGEHEKALAIAERAMEYFPEDFYAYYMLAVIHDNLEHKEKAVAFYFKSLELHPMKNSIAADRIFRLTGKRAPAYLEKLDSNRIPFVKQNKVMIVDAFANGHPGKFMVDTGASYTVILEKNIEKYDVTVIPITSEVQTGNGKTEMQACYLDIQLGEYTLKNHICFVAKDFEKGKKIDGILGMNVFEHFRMEVDNSSHELILHR